MIEEVRFQTKQNPLLNRLLRAPRRECSEKLALSADGDAPVKGIDARPGAHWGEEIFCFLSTLVERFSQGSTKRDFCKKLINCFWVCSKQGEHLELTS